MASAKPVAGDLVRVERGGRSFFAEVTGDDGGLFNILPIAPNISYRTTRNKDIVTVYRKLGRSRAGED